MGVRSYDGANHFESSLHHREVTAIHVSLMYCPIPANRLPFRFIGTAFA